MKATATSESEHAPTGDGLGILGGSFNPPHLGHLALARHAVAELGLERVLLMPVCLPPHRPAPPVQPGASHRVQMCRLLSADEDRLEVSTLEVDRGGRSYTVHTLEALAGERPGVELTLVLGADTALTLSSWREPGRIVELARLAVARRHPIAERAVERAVRKLSREARVAFLRMAPVDISSTLARQRCRRGKAIDELVGPAVASYIATHQLYGSGATAAVA